MRCLELIDTQEKGIEVGPLVYSANLRKYFHTDNPHPLDILTFDLRLRKMKGSIFIV